MRALGDPAAAAAPHVSVILPVHNAEPWLDECLRSVLQQDFQGSMELSVFNDASQDRSAAVIERWKGRLEDAGIPVVIGGHDAPAPRGVGYSKNQAIAQSSGSYLCFLDSVFTSHGPTVIMPTWFCSRAWFFHVGPFDEGGQGVPEDLLFFYDHLRKGGGVVRVDQSLLLYRYLPDAATHSVLETTIWTHRVRFLEERVLPRWAAFTIWNAGRQGRRLYRSLTAEARRKVGRQPRPPHPRPAAPSPWPPPPRLPSEAGVLCAPQVVAFCDVDENKIRKGFYCHEDSQVCGPRAPGRTASSHMGCPHHPSSDPGYVEQPLPRAFLLGEDHQAQQQWPHCWGSPNPEWPVSLPSLGALSACRSSMAGRPVGPAWTPAHKTSCSQERPKPRVPILHFRAARPPFVICVKLDLTGGAFEDNLRSLHLREGQDFLHFS
ncbi:UDP-GlcNAc:betaGal beta-1,3-N-acetylglucosaminyltransferase-like protein 1 isoform X6 [Mustela erminea]|uniref:UDP-GlcNAc:betaGal beta-1,3-N-acetylglucosaminyltransferase-like protein 1 isoform X6 n=1 Tax=Mustela erminea TaxID=36723 RepID=UPI0013869E19|nr:UDP-GlcNAc:betaGal beta-1,3-N-acetylglucosaminyltransferase-like protein 1 isoform X6 [Mustela erminea]